VAVVVATASDLQQQLVPHGTLRVALTGKGASRAAGTLEGRRVSLSFRLGR
jgi:hypothetical protein